VTGRASRLDVTAPAPLFSSRFARRLIRVTAGLANPLLQPCAPCTAFACDRWRWPRRRGVLVQLRAQAQAVHPGRPPTSLLDSIGSQEVLTGVRRRPVAATRSC
jgi:hypothetical protein